MHAGLSREAKGQEPNTWKQSEVFAPLQEGSNSQPVAKTGWALTWKMVDGRKSAKARKVAKGYQEPYSGESDVDTSGSVSNPSWSP